MYFGSSISTEKPEHFIKVPPGDKVHFMGRERGLIRSKDLEICHRDEKSHKLTHVKISQVSIANYMNDTEKRVPGRKRITRGVLSGNTHLDARFAFAFYENQDILPTEWRTDEQGKNRLINFDGTVFVDKLTGHKYTLCIYWTGDFWEIDLCWVDGDGHWIINFLHRLLDRGMAGKGFSATIKTE